MNIPCVNCGKEVVVDVEFLVEQRASNPWRHLETNYFGCHTGDQSGILADGGYRFTVEPTKEAK